MKTIIKYLNNGKALIILITFINELTLRTRLCRLREFYSPTSALSAFCFTAFLVEYNKNNLVLEIQVCFENESIIILFRNKILKFQLAMTTDLRKM